MNRILCDDFLDYMNIRPTKHKKVSIHISPSDTADVRSDASGLTSIAGIATRLCAEELETDAELETRMIKYNKEFAAYMERLSRTEEEERQDYERLKAKFEK